MLHYQLCMFPPSSSYLQHHFHMDSFKILAIEMADISVKKVQLAIDTEKLIDTFNSSLNKCII